MVPVSDPFTSLFMFIRYKCVHNHWLQYQTDLSELFLRAEVIHRGKMNWSYKASLLICHIHVQAHRILLIELPYKILI